VKLLAAELLKVRTAPRTLIGVVLGLVALAVIGSASTAHGVHETPLGDENTMWDVLTVGTTAAIFTLILGILIVTWEYRHGTITQTFLVTPRRENVIGAKLAVSFAAGAVLGALSVVLVVTTALYWISFDLTRGQWELIGRILLGCALWGVLGAGLGALLQSQVEAIVAAFVWFLVAEPLISIGFDRFADYLPGAALDRLTQRGPAEGTLELGQDFSFGLWTAALLVAAYAVGFAVLGIASAVRRDVS
jgi:ABC-2 type transport system permease protein